MCGIVVFGGVRTMSVGGPTEGVTTRLSCSVTHPMSHFPVGRHAALDVFATTSRTPLYIADPSRVRYLAIEPYTQLQCILFVGVELLPKREREKERESGIGGIYLSIDRSIFRKKYEDQHHYHRIRTSARGPPQ